MSGVPLCPSPASRAAHRPSRARKQGSVARLAHEASKARDALALTKANARRWCSRPISSWKSGKVDLARLGSWPRQCVKRLTLIRRNMPKTHTALRCRTVTLCLVARSVLGASIFDTLGTSPYGAPQVLDGLAQSFVTDSAWTIGNGVHRGGRITFAGCLDTGCSKLSDEG